MKRKKWLIYTLTSLATLSICGCGMISPSLDEGFDPKKVYSSSFNNAIAEIDQLKSGGFVWQETDIWIRFQSQGAITLKNSHKYQLGNTNEIKFESKRFIEELSKQQHNISKQDLASLNDVNNLKYLKYLGENNSGKSLLYNTQTKIYYFRVWNHQ
jgi:hypothetical protein